MNGDDYTDGRLNALPRHAPPRRNRNFRLLFIGQTISQLGDWFNAVAVYALLLDLTGSATAVAWMMIVQFLPMAIVGPLAGVVVDRVESAPADDRDRHRCAASLILGLLLVRQRRSGVDRLRRDGAHRRRVRVLRAGAHRDDPQHHVGRGADAGQRAVERDVVGDARDRRVDRRAGDAPWPAATSRSSSTPLSFFASAFFIAARGTTSTPAAPGRGRGRNGLRSALDRHHRSRRGLRYVRQHAHVAALMFVKAGLGARRRRAAAADDLRPARLSGRRGRGGRHRRPLRRARHRRRPRTDRAALDPRPEAAPPAPGDRPGLLHGRRLLHRARAARRRSAVAALCVLCAHFGGSILWVFSTVLLQIEVPDRFRGRVFAAELALVTLVSSVSSYWTGYELDQRGAASPRTLVMFCVLGAVCLPAWRWLWLDRSSARVAVERRLSARCRLAEALHRALHQLLRVVELLETRRCPSSACRKAIAAAVDAVLTDSASESVRRSSATASRPRAVPICVSWCSSVSRCLSKRSFRGFDGRSSTRLGRLRGSWRSRLSTTSATSSGAIFQSAPFAASPLENAGRDRSRASRS